MPPFWICFWRQLGKHCVFCYCLFDLLKLIFHVFLVRKFLVHRKDIFLNPEWCPVLLAPFCLLSFPSRYLRHNPTYPSSVEHFQKLSHQKGMNSQITTKLSRILSLNTSLISFLHWRADVSEKKLWSNKLNCKNVTSLLLDFQLHSWVPLCSSSVDAFKQSSDDDLVEMF